MKIVYNYKSYLNTGQRRSPNEWEKYLRIARFSTERDLPHAARK